YSLRYVWELTIYFAYYVFPFINDLFTTRAFVPGFLQRFSRLGPLNRGMQEFLMGYYGWKKEHMQPPAGGPLYFDFYEVWALKSAETCFYKVGVTPEEARGVLDEQLAHLEELARWVYAYVAASVLGDERALTDPGFVGAIDPEKLVFDPQQMAERLAACPRIDGALGLELRAAVTPAFPQRRAADGDDGDGRDRGGGSPVTAFAGSAGFQPARSAQPTEAARMAALPADFAPGLEHAFSLI